MEILAMSIPFFHQFILSLPLRLFFTILLITTFTACSFKQPVPTMNTSGSEGRGTPTVVLQSGLGDDNTVWEQVIPELTPDFTVIALNRPGYGDTAATDSPRDPCTIAAEQHAQLQTAGLRPPYILVGHSLGGLYQYVYAKLYPDEVAGIVLLDPTHPRNWEMLQSTAPGIATMVKALKAVSVNEVKNHEFDDQITCLETLQTDHPLNMPGKILVSGRLGMMAENTDYSKQLTGLRQDWARMTGVSQPETVWDSGHYIQKEAPADVIAAVQQVATTLMGKEKKWHNLDPPVSPTIEFDKEKHQIITVGKTTQAQIKGAKGEPDEKMIDGDHQVWVYQDKSLDIPLAISFVPIIGDVLDVIDTADKMLVAKYELIIQFDNQGVVSRFKQRKMD